MHVEIDLILAIANKVGFLVISQPKFNFDDAQHLAGEYVIPVEKLMNDQKLLEGTL